MTRFIDGPAAGVALELGRAPTYLRVTCDTDGTWDALDQFLDTPNADEAVYVYRLVSNDGTVHLDGTDKRGRRIGRWLAMATYSYLADQPPESVLRDNMRWREWAKAEQAKATEGT